MARRIGSLILQLCGGIVLTIALFWLCATLYTRHNTQPSFYHPDEGTKTGQILRDDRNFNHPQLMLEMTLLVSGGEPNRVFSILRTLGLESEPTPREREAVTVAGRRASAYLAAGAVVLCAWAGFAATRSWLGFVMGATGAGLCPALYSHAHFFKEDASLVFGMSCVLVVGSIFCLRRWHWAWMLVLAGLLGAACGVAASGKYSGAVFLAPAVLLVLVLTIGRWWLMPILPVVLIAGAVWSWCGINYRAMERPGDWENFREGFDNERLHSQSEHFGLTMDKPNGYFLDAVWGEAMPHVKALAFCGPLALLLQRRRRGERWPIDFGWWLLACGAIYLLALSHSVLPFFRYALPVTVMLYLFAALAVVWIARVIDLCPVWRGAIVTALLVLTVGLQAQRVADYDDQHANDSRDALRAWATGALPRFGRIVAEDYTGLRGLGAPAPYASPLRVVGTDFAGDAGTVEELRASGYQYVAIASSRFDRYFSPHTKPATNDDGSPDPRSIERFNRRLAFYRTLFEKHPILWHRKAEHPMGTFINPDIYVFRIGDPPPARTRTP